MAKTSIFKTVAAISTPHGKGGVSMIRISGEMTKEIVDKCFKPMKKTLMSEEPYRKAVYGNIVSDDSYIDSGICVLYEEGKSFTGESMAEISCHGGTYVTYEVLSAVFSAGAESAGAGEFTKRAFINGKITLTEAEAIGTLIDANTESRADLSRSGASGILSKKISAISEKLLSVLASIYAVIDYPDEDLDKTSASKLAETLDDSSCALLNLLSTYKTGKAVQDGVKTIICGAPNTGKSSLFNAIVGSDRAIVTDIAGTTRDTIEEAVDFAGITLLLSDTAGIRDTKDIIETAGIRKAEKIISESDLVLALFDISRPFDEEEMDNILSIKGPVNHIAVISKSDLENRLTEEDIDKISSHFDKVSYISTESENGLDSLKKVISSLYKEDKLDIRKDAIVWNGRQKASIERGLSYVQKARSDLLSGAPIDAVGATCEAALAELNLTDGKDISDSIVDEIFSHFCVGK